MGIEPTALAWEARVLPLYDVREVCNFTCVSNITQQLSLIKPWGT